MAALLAPLTSAADLPKHPSLSIPFTSNTLSDMAQQACEMVHRERKTLWSVKHLLTTLRGDDTWIPCGTLDDPDVDEAIFGTAFLYNRSTSIASRGGNNVLESGDGKGSTHTQNGPTIELEPHASRDIHHASNEMFQKEFEAVPQIEVDQIVMDDFVTPANHDIFQEEFEAIPRIEADQIVLADFTAPDTMNVNTKKTLREPTGTGRGDGDVSKTQDIGHTPSEGDTATSGLQMENITANKKLLDAAEEPGDAANMNPVTASETSHQDQISDLVEKDVLPPPAEPSKEPTIIKDPTDDQPRPDPLPQERKTVSNAHETKADKPITTTANSDPPPKPEDPRNPTLTRSTSHSSTSHPPPHRMLTRAQAAASTPASPHPTPTPTRSPSPPPYIHPLYIPPASSHRSRDLGLPQTEAEETRRICTLWVQKQEEIVRGAERLYEGLLKADRMRKSVWKWCKAEGHVGEMSDGEDWYDREEWGLEGELRKGNLEEEEEVGETRGKKGRGRRGI